MGTMGLRFNEHMDHEDGPLVFAHACKLGDAVPAANRLHATAPRWPSHAKLEQAKQPNSP